MLFQPLLRLRLTLLLLLLLLLRRQLWLCGPQQLLPADVAQRLPLPLHLQWQWGRGVAVALLAALLKK